MAKVAAIGFFVYGAVYVAVGALAAKVALGTGGRITSSEGAIREVARQSFGSVLLVVTAVGLFAYSSWRLVQAITTRKDTGGARRASSFVSAGW